MKNYLVLFALLFAVIVNSSAQFSFVHISDLHVLSIQLPNSDYNAQNFQCYMKEFTDLAPKPAFVLVSLDISYFGKPSR